MNGGSGNGWRLRHANQSLADTAAGPRHVRHAPESHADYFDSTFTCCSTTTGSVKANVEP